MDADRHARLRAGLAATGRDAQPGRPPAGSRFAGQPEDQVSPPFDGTLRLDDDARAAASGDFGQILHQAPEGVLFPTSDLDVAAMVRWAGGLGRRIAPRGQGHSVYGRAQVRDGFVIDMARLAAIHEVGAHAVVVGAGATLKALLDATLPHGLSPPVLADYLGLSVGGVLAVGGIGGATLRHGFQSDNVLEMDVVTGTGAMITCSPHGDAELFHATLAGLGQFGVITRATLKLVPAPERARRYILHYPDLGSLLADQRLLAADLRFDVAQGSALPTPNGWIFRLDAARYFSGEHPPDDSALLRGLSDDRPAADLSTLSYFDHLDRLAALEAALKSNGQWGYPHPWLMTFIGGSDAEAVIAGELKRLTPADLGAFGQVAISAFPRAAATGPLPRLPADDLVYAFNMVRIPTTDAAAEADRLIKDNRAIYERIRAAGGTLYPVSALPMSQADWRSHFGPYWPQVESSKKSFDPGRILTPGYEIFADA
jgi:FAD/FMN-containing dehydrogenase